MKFTDIVELAKQGYKPSDIEQLLKLSVESEGKPEESPKGEEPQKEIHKGSETPPEEKPTESEPSDDSSIDYKKLYEDTLAKLQNAQKGNTKQNLKDDNTKSDDELLQELARSFM